MMLTHIVYTINIFGRLYFAGKYIEDNKGNIDIVWKWTYNKRKATYFYTVDAWDLKRIAEDTHRFGRFEVQRIITLQEMGIA